MTRPANNPVVLCILDGFGQRDNTENNAIALAKTPTIDRLRVSAPTALIHTSGEHVGLPSGQMGNSEVGHMNLGAGRIVMQDLPKIDEAINSGSIRSIKALENFIAALKNSGGTAHLLGLLSPGGVHSHQDHMIALARILTAENINVVIHAFMDGRDTAPKSGLGFMKEFEKDLGGAGKIGTVSGRYFAMDRDKNWERVEKSYRVVADGSGDNFQTATLAIETSYGNSVSDEFIEPVVIGEYAGMKDGDGVLMANFRADRAREILTVLGDPTFDGFAREGLPELAALCGLVDYSSAHSEYMTSLFPADDIQNTLGEVVANSGLKQLRIAETEKYAHVTFFFNGGKEDVFPGEERILVPSPKVATYDLQPEMSAPEVTDNLVRSILAKKFDLIVVNFANGDMVGHTGVLPAAIEAVETLDTSIGRLETALKTVGGVMLVTADHGNAEMMIDEETGEPHTQHTTLDVPLFLVNAEALEQPVSLRNGKLADLAPTCLALLGLDQPAEMTGNNLLVPASEKSQAADQALTA